MMSPVRRPIALLALWLTAAIVCTTLGWFTVGIVSGQGRQSSLPPPIQTTTTHDDAEADAVGPQPAIASGSAATTSTSTSTSTTTTTTTAPGTPFEAPPPADDADPAAGAALPGAPSPQGTAAAPLPRAPAPATVAALPVAPPPTPAPTPSATIISTGGSVAVLYDESNETISLLWATPNDGFTMDLQDTGPDKVEVRFESDDAESRVFAWWDGAPRERVEETD